MDTNHDGTTDESIRYVFDGDQEIEECDLSSGTVLKFYVYGNYVDEPLWFEDTSSSTEYLYGQDENFSVYALLEFNTVSQTASTVEQYRFDAYGSFQRYDSSGTESGARNSPSTFGNPWLFQGRRFDPESGLYYFRARFLNSTTGRFISFDALGYTAGPLNLYEFERSTPLDMLDPSGMLAPQIVGAITGAIWGGVSAFASSLLSGESFGMAAVRGGIGALTGAIEGILIGSGVPYTVASTIMSALEAALNAAVDEILRAIESKCGIDLIDLLSNIAEAALDAAIQNLMMGELGKYAGKLAKSLGLDSLAAKIDGGGGGNKGGTPPAEQVAKTGGTYRHYGYAADADKFAGGLKPGSYATQARGRPMSGATAQEKLALPHEKAPDAYYKVHVGPETPVVGPSPVAPTSTPPRSGGGVEFKFPEGTPPGSVLGPFPIPPGGTK